MKKRATVNHVSITVGSAAEVRDLSDDPTALAEAQATLERHSGARMVGASAPRPGAAAA